VEIWSLFVLCNVRTTYAMIVSVTKFPSLQGQFREQLLRRYYPV
jgi:hypothetical protein